MKIKGLKIALLFCILMCCASAVFISSVNTVSASVDIEQTDDFVVVITTDKFHYPYCYHLDRAYDYNKREERSSIKKLIDDGYSPCEDCIGYINYNPHSTTNRSHDSGGSVGGYVPGTITTSPTTNTTTTNKTTTNIKEWNQPANRNNKENEHVHSIGIVLWGIVVFIFVTAIVVSIIVAIRAKESVLYSIVGVLMMSLYGIILPSMVLSFIVGIFIKGDIFFYVAIPFLIILCCLCWGVYTIKTNCEENKKQT